MLEKPRHVILIKILRYNLFQLNLTLMVTSMYPSARYPLSHERKKKYSLKKIMMMVTIIIFLVEGLAVWRMNGTQSKPVGEETVKNYSARTLKLLSPQNRYIGHQGGI